MTNLQTTAAGLSEAQRLTKGQRAFFRAVANGSGGQFHRSAIDPIEGLPYGKTGGLVAWAGSHRLVGRNAFSADDFALTDDGRAYLKERGE